LMPRTTDCAMPATPPAADTRPLRWPAPMPPLMAGGCASRDSRYSWLIYMIVSAEEDAARRRRHAADADAAFDAAAAASFSMALAPALIKHARAAKDASDAIVSYGGCSASASAGGKEGDAGRRA